MEIEYTVTAKNDIDFWKKSGNKIVLKKIRSLIESIKETPFEGVGKPEELKYDLAGFWSRRINQEHRLIYELNDGKIFIISAKGHYI